MASRADNIASNLNLGNFAKVNEIMARYFTQPYPARAAIGEQAALTIVGGADLRFDDTTGSSLVVLRKSTSAAVATVPLRRGTRTQPIIGNG